MTANELKFSFQLKFDSLFEFSAPAYDDRHISYLLTEAQFRVFIKRYNPLGNKYQKGFEGNEQRRRDLEQLIKSVSIIGTAVTAGSVLGKSASQTGIHPNGVFLDLPTDYLYAIEEACTLKPNTTGAVARTVESWIKPVRHDEYLANINNPYKQPYKDLVWRMDMSRLQNADGTSTQATAKRTELIYPKTYTLSKYRVRYLAMPPSIVVDEFDPTQQKHCVLDETLHREIVDEAVAIAQAAVKKEEYQIGRAETAQSE